METLNIDGAQIEYEVRGAGEPVLLIHLSLIADGLAFPLFAQAEIAGRCQLIHYHRRGYPGSSLGLEPLTISRGARDAATLLRHLGVKDAHVVGHSIGGLIALQLAVDAPELVGSLALLEPSLTMVPSAKASQGQLFGPMLEAYRSGNKGQAAEIFCGNVFSPNWQAIVERAVPGGVEQAVAAMDTFVQELAPMQAWQFGLQQAALVHQPVLSVLGVARRNALMEEGRELIHAWFPQAEDCDLPTWHGLQMEDPRGAAHALMEFFACHAAARLPEG
ncbi:MAG TPA: alpha/beta hydrolase [Anaerolineaceae bacterium]